MRTITVNVTQEDIDAGEPGHACGCPLALAIARATDCKVFIVAGIWTSTSGHRGPLPESAHRWYWAFDQGKPVSPFSFTIEWPEVAHGGS
jgi:hypothetical protein